MFQFVWSLCNLSKRQQHPSVFFQANIKLTAFKLKMNLKYRQWSPVFSVSEFKSPESGSELIQLCISCVVQWLMIFFCLLFLIKIVKFVCLKISISPFPPVIMKGRHYKVFWYVVFHSTKFSTIMRSKNSPSSGYPDGELGVSLGGKRCLINLWIALFL